MPSRSPRLFAAFILALALQSLTAQSPMALNDCINYAYNNHPDIKTAELQIRDADWQIKENTASGLPQIAAGLAYQYFLKVPALPAEALGFAAPPGTRIAFQLRSSLSGNIQYNQLLFSNSYLVALRASRYYKEYVQLQLQTTRQTVRNQVIDAYLPVLLLAENLKLLDKNIANLEKLLSDTRAINKAGFAEQLDVDRLELSLATLRSERDNLARQQSIVTDALKFAMGYPVSNALLVGDQIDPLLAAYADADLASPVNFNARPEYTQLLKGRDLSGVQVDLYAKPWMPTVAGFVQAQGSYQGNDKLFWIPASVAGISVSLPIWDGGTSKAKLERAKLSAQQVDIQRGMLENAITLEVEAARKQYLNATERVANQQKNLGLAQRIYAATETKYKAGIGSSFELVTAEQQVTAAQQNLLQAQYDLLTARVAVKKALGQP